MISTNKFNEVAVVVGATGSFGKAIVAKLAAAGVGVLAVARSAENLRTLVKQHPGVMPCIADISSDTSIQIISAALDKPVRMVVHGPGVAVAGGILTAPTSALVDAVNIKVGGMLRLTRAVDAHLVSGSRLVAIGGGGGG
jgi:NADP-dependent 3-hydroxy acid dehydrogenase YdfG